VIAACPVIQRISRSASGITWSLLQECSSLRAGGNPVTTDAALRRRSATMKRRREARLVWEREHDGQVFDSDLFRSEILPMLVNIPTIKLARKTGLSKPYGALIKRGKRVPHPMHWSNCCQNLRGSRSGDYPVPFKKGKADDRCERPWMKPPVRSTHAASSRCLQFEMGPSSS